MSEHADLWLISSRNKSLRWIFICCLAGCLFAAGCSRQPYGAILSGTNAVKITNTLREIGAEGGANRFMKIAKRVGGANGFLYRFFYRFSSQRKMKAYRPLIEKLALEGRSAAIRCEALQTLGKINAVESADVLQQLLAEKDIRIVQQTIITIAQLDLSAFVVFLKPKLKDPAVQEFAIWCIGEIGRPEDAAFIVPFLDAKDANIRYLSYKALQRLE